MVCKPSHCHPPNNPHGPLPFPPAPRPQPNGGAPVLLSGNVVLCSRADANSERHFDGQLAYLGEKL